MPIILLKGISSDPREFLSMNNIYMHQKNLEKNPSHYLAECELFR